MAKHGKRAAKGSRCVSWKKTSAGRRCAVFGRKGKGKGKGKGLAGAISECKRYKTITIKHGRKKGDRVLRCAVYSQGPGYPSVEYRVRAGVRKPDSVARLSARETHAREGRMKKNILRYRPSAL